MKVLISSAYFGSIDHWIAIKMADKLLLEREEHFVKQSFRNRTSIYGPNGKQKLIIPLIKLSESTSIKDIQISFNKNNKKWTSNHWKSLEAAYRNSPYFEFYEDELKPLFDFPEKELFKQNIKTMEWLAAQLEINFQPHYTTSYKKEHKNILDLRDEIHPKKEIVFHQEPYLQTFQEKKGFLPNLSVLDLLFNLGPQSFAYIAKRSRIL